MSRKDYAKKIAYIGVILVLVLVILISGLRILESTVFSPGQGESEVPIAGTYEKDGVTYLLRSDITVVMMLGIGEEGVMEDSGSYNNDYEADMVSLLIFNETTKKCDVLCLNRDTMVNMKTMGIDGREADTVYRQLALAYNYGSGLKDSCKNFRSTVSDFLKGIEIDYYMAFRMDAVKIINDAVGGVTVNITEDFSKVDDTIPMGEHTLMGDQALNYVSKRADVGDQTNVSRMERQSGYMKGLLESFKKANENDQFALDLYAQVEPYMVTDFTTKSLSAVLNRYGDYELGEIINLNEGSNQVVNGHYQFVADEEKLEELALRLFYQPRS